AQPRSWRGVAGRGYHRCRNRPRAAVFSILHPSHPPPLAQVRWSTLKAYFLVYCSSFAGKPLLAVNRNGYRITAPRTLGPRGSRPLERLCWRVRARLQFAGQFGIRQPLAHDLPDKVAEAVAVIHGLAVVESESLLIDVPEQVVGLD